MSQMIPAVFEDGVLKPLQKLALGEHQQVQITVEPRNAVAGMRGEDLPAVVVPIATLDPEPCDVLRDIPVVLQPADDGWLATFFDANIGITGDTKEEAVANLRLLLVDVFERLEAEESALGPQLLRQLAVLRGFMKRRV